VTEILCRGNKPGQALAPQPLRGLSQPFEPSFVFYNIPGSFVKNQLPAVSLRLSANLLPSLDNEGSGRVDFFTDPLFS
jgi:hypothetical protein